MLRGRPEDEARKVAFRNDINQFRGVLREFGALDRDKRRRHATQCVGHGDADRLGPEIEAGDPARGRQGRGECGDVVV
jgi:hypothetical protein